VGCPNRRPGLGCHARPLAGRDYLSGDDGQAAVRSLTAIERITCTWLIARQFARWPAMPVALAKYGPQGTVRLAAARAMFAYVSLGVVIPTAFSVAGIATVAVPAWVLIFLLLVPEFAEQSRRTGREGAGEVPSRKPSLPTDIDPLSRAGLTSPAT
jgi:hypothetical protein